MAPASAQPLPPQPLFSAIAESGEPAPGWPGGGVFDAFDAAPAIDANGAVLFGAAVGAGEGLWSTVGGSLQPIARSGDPAPSTGETLSGFTSSSLGFAGGAAAFEAVLTGDPGMNVSLWSSSAGVLRLLARESEPAPGLGSGVAFVGAATFFNLRTNGQDRSAFYARLGGAMVTGGTNVALFAEDATGSPQPVFREGAPAPFIAGDPVFGPLDEITGQYAFSDSGAIAFSSPLSGPAVTNDNNTALFYRAPGGTILPLLVEGGIAPGLDPGVLVGNIFFTPSLDELGGLACVIGLAGPGVIPGRDQALVVAPVGVELAPVVFAGDPAPDTRSGVTFDTLISATRSGEHTALIAQVTGPGVTTDNDRGVWIRSDDGQLTRVAREGDPLSGAPGVVLNSISNPSINPQGLAVFPVTLSGSGVTADNDRALCYASLGQPARILIREGDQVALLGSAPTPRTIQSFEFRSASGGQDGLLTGLNADGRATILIRFTNGSAAVVITHLPPCPADANNDGTVSPPDFSAWIAAFNAQSPACDQNGDGQCLPNDFASWIQNFNAGCP
jgi:hypothetical protein